MLLEQRRSLEACLGGCIDTATLSSRPSFFYLIALRGDFRSDGREGGRGGGCCGLLADTSIISGKFVFACILSFNCCANRKGSLSFPYRAQA